MRVRQSMQFIRLDHGYLVSGDVRGTQAYTLAPPSCDVKKFYYILYFYCHA